MGRCNKKLKQHGPAALKGFSKYLEWLIVVQKCNKKYTPDWFLKGNYSYFLKNYAQKVAGLPCKNYF
jgi:hypothetical protein